MNLKWFNNGPSGAIELVDSITMEIAMHLKVSVNIFNSRYLKLAVQRDEDGIPYYIEKQRVVRVEILDPPDDWKAYINKLAIVPPWTLNIRSYGRPRTVEKFLPEPQVVKFKNKLRNSTYDKKVESQRLNK